MSLGLGTSLLKGGLATPGIVTDSLVLKHNYAVGAVVPVSDGAAFFDGTDDYIEVSSNGTGTFNNQSFTISAWIKVGGAGYNRTIFSYDYTSHDAPYYACHLRIDDANKIYLAWNDGTNLQKILTSSTYTTGQWYHVVGTHTSGSQKIYVDGVEVASDTRTDTITYYAQEVWIGKMNGGNVMNGYICNVGIWSAALTQPQIKSIMWKNYAGLTSTETTNLVSWWNLDEGIATDGNKGWVADNHDITFGSNITPTWGDNGTDSVINGQVITLPSSGIHSATTTVASGIHKINVTVTDYTGSGAIEMPWDGSGSSNMQISANGTYEFYESAADSSWIVYAADGRGCTITINSIQKADGNIGELL